jgi:prepilin-type N-terminal cleavage/methylation domain-containing protein
VNGTFKRSRGFSLLEVIVALTIATLMFTVAFRGISVSLDTLMRIEQANRRIALVRSKLAELDLCGPIRPGDHASGTFDDGTRWVVDTSALIPATEMNSSSVVRIALRIDWQGRGGPQHREIATYRFVQTQPNQTIPSLEDQLRDLQ